MTDSDVKLLFCGDFATCRRWYDYSPNISVFGDMLPYIQNSDLSFLNLETPATICDRPIKKDGPNLKTKPEWLKSIEDAGFILIGLANNHMGDFGPEGVLDCIKKCHNESLQTVGAGKNLDDSQKIFYFCKNDVKVAIIAVCEHEYGIAECSKAGTAPLDVIDNIRQINEAKQNADFVIITIHGGNEYFPYPRPGLRKQCQFYVEQGCDAVVCHHPHVPGGYEIYNDKPIFYSLGNFVFDAEKPPVGWNEGYAVNIKLAKTNHKIEFELIPYSQSFDQGGVRLMTEVEKEKFLYKIESYRATLSNLSEYSKVWDDFCKSKTDDHLILQYCPIRFPGIGRLLRILGPEILVKNTKRLTGRLNFIRCESHREVIINILEMVLNAR